MKIIVKDDYFISSKEDLNIYRKLKKKIIPNIYKVSLYNKTILYLYNRFNDAAKGFLYYLDKKMSYQKLSEFLKYLKLI